jgi:UDP-glucose 4-epimerase
MAPAEKSAEAKTLVITGSSGFLGSHLSAAVADRPSDKVCGIDIALPVVPASYTRVTADIRSVEALRIVRESWGRPDALIHLAASAEVLTPWLQVPTLLSTNIDGTFNVADTLMPRSVIFASSSSIYGNAPLAQTDPLEGKISPLCLYASSKLTGERILGEWARETGNSAVALRLGNLVGPRCRGLIPYLVGHARRYPDGSVRAKMRGHGELVRDYVPVGYVAGIFLAAAETAWESACLNTFNVGTGRAMTNRAVAEIVQRIVTEYGLHLEIDWDNPIGPGEATEVVLDMKKTVRQFGLPLPGPDEVVSAIEESVRGFCQNLCASS